MGYMGFGVRGLGVQESGLDQDPYQKKYTFTSIYLVPVVQIEQMRAHLKGLSARIVMSSESMVTCASGLLPSPAKVPFFQYRAWWYSIVQKFHNDGKKIQDSQFWAYFGLHPWSGQSHNISKLGMMVFYRLEISYWWLKIIFYFFSCPVTDQQPKNVLPISVATRNFLFIYN
jgi:hypothetical protein